MTDLRTVYTSPSGRRIDLARPLAADIDFRDIAECLAKLARYSGATPGQVYSVAEHCCRGADAILAHGESEDLAAYFLLHDAHEALIGDDTTPKKHALRAVLDDRYGPWVGERIEEAHYLLTYRIDNAIHCAAGLRWPPPTSLQLMLRHWDLVMFETEWRDLMVSEVPRPMSERPEPLKETIGNGGAVKCWPWEVARTAYLARCKKLLPALRTEAS